ncbi:MAG TPA: peptidoglycan-binding domain-containing protein, partial [Dehalococcoidia bacterium]|nr:peptidoglycan-binding domain-containing protein [Dehalococcoidia bacterium]
MNGRSRVAGIALAGVVLAGAIGWFVGSQIDSPAEVASRTAPPAAAPILVPAEERVLSTDIITRGTARFGSPQQLALAPSSLKTGSGVAARLPLPGTELREGDSVFLTSGRPVFLLAGQQPSYRDLGPGITGEDVRQLEEALVRLGFNPGPADGVYDSSTEGAVTAWYQRSGFAPFTASAEQLAAMRALETDFNSAQIDVIGAQESVSSAEAALNAADAAYARALATSQSSESALSAAVTTANANDKAAVAAVNSRQAALNALVAAGATSEEIAAADAELALARASADVTRVTGDGDVAAAQAALTSARADVTSALADVRAAEKALEHADAALSVRFRQSDLVGQGLSLARLQAGVQVPADEVIFVANTPVRVSEAVARVDQAIGPLITVTNAVVAIDGSLRLEEAPLAKAGMAVAIDEPDLGIKATGTISRVAEAPGTNGVDGFHVYFEILVDGSPPSLVGASVRLTVPVESTGGSVLAVPVSAVTLSADGSSRIQRQHDGALEFVTV